MDELLNKSPVTSSAVEVTDYGKDDKIFQKYVYVECSGCRALYHLMRVSVWLDKSGQDVMSSVSFELPAEWYTDPGWKRVEKGAFVRFIQRIAVFGRRLKLAFKVLVGGTVYIGSSPDFSFATARELSKKIVDAIDDVEKSSSQ